MNPIARMMKRYIKTPLKYALPLLFIGSLALVSISGCTSPTSSNQAAGNASPTASTSASASALVTPSVTSSNTPSPTVTPPADVYQVVISGPTVLQPGEGGLWTATVYKNGVAMSQSDLTGKVYWFIDGNYHQTNTMMGDPINSAVMRSDANGEETTWAPPGAHILNAEYMGNPSYPNTSITVTSLGMPTPTPFVPTATPFPTATPTSIPTLTPTIIR